MKKTIFIISGLVLVLFLTVSCAKKNQTSSDGESHRPVTLSLWVWDDAQVPATRAMTNAFTAKYPWITVETTCIPGVGDFNIKVQSVMGSRDAPSVFWLNFNLAREYVPTGTVADLTPYINKDTSFDIKKLNAGITAAYTIDGKIYAIPKDTDSYACFYNKEVFDGAGVAYPANSWNYQDFADIARRLTRGNVKGWANTTSDRVLYGFIWGNGGEIYSANGMESLVNSPQSVEAMQLVMDLQNQGYAYNDIELAEVNTNMAFISGLCGMVIDGSWMISQFADGLGDNLGIVEVPSGRTGKGSAGHGIGYATTTSNQNMDETWLLLAYLGSDEAQAMQVEVVIPAANSSAAVWEDVYPNVNLSAFVTALGYSRPIPLSAKNPSRTRSVAQEYFGNMRAGMYKDAKEAMDAMKKALDDSIND